MIISYLEAQQQLLPGMTLVGLRTDFKDKTLYIALGLDDRVPGLRLTLDDVEIFRHALLYVTRWPAFQQTTNVITIHKPSATAITVYSALEDTPDQESVLLACRSENIGETLWRLLNVQPHTPGERALGRRWTLP